MILPSEQDDLIGNYDSDLQPRTQMNTDTQDQLWISLQAYKDGDISLDGIFKDIKYFTEYAFTEGKPITHETFLIGFNPEGDVVFFKSYDYLRQKDEAQSDLSWVINHCDHWELGAASEWKLTHEVLIHDIVIPHP